MEVCFTRSARGALVVYAAFPQETALSRFQSAVSSLLYFVNRFILCYELGINAITGGKRDEKPPNGLQDYLVGGPGKQPWLDGIATEPGVVRQVCRIVRPFPQRFSLCSLSR